MVVMGTIIGVIGIAMAGILLYRWGVKDGMRFCRMAARPRLLDQKDGVKQRDTVIDTAEQQRQWQQIANFMQYDGSEMPRVGGGDNT